MAWQALDVAQLDSVLNETHAVLLDIRDAASFARSRIPGAQAATEHTVKRLLRERLPARPIVVYCYHGNSSRDFCQLLAGFGFTRLYNLEGGWQAWLNAQAPTTAPAVGELAAWLQAGGFNPDRLDGRIANATTPLMLAAQQGRLELVEQLLAAGADVNLLNDDGNGALWFACVHGDTRLLSRVIEAGADLDNQNVNGATALIYAASAGKLEVANALVSAGADIERQTLDGFTALDSAATLPVLRFLKPHFAA